MNILYIEHYAGSPDMGMEFRPYYLSREWVKMGHRVDILAADYSHLRIKNPRVTKDFQKEEIDGINYYWIRTSTYEGNGLKRAINMAQFVGKLYLKAEEIAEKHKPDIIITSSTYPLDTYVGQKIKKFCPSAKLIHEIHDMWPAVLVGIFGMKKVHPFVLLMQLAENSFCRNSDYIVSLQPNTKAYLEQHGMSSEKWCNVNNGVVLSEWEKPQSLPSEHKEVFDRLHNEGKFVICFFGTISKSYALDYLTDNEYCSSIKKIAKGKMESNFIFLPKVPKLSIPSLLKEPDALYVASVASWVMQFGISMNKLFDSMMSGKPIIYAMGAPNNYIEKYNCGISVMPESIDALATGIQRMYMLSEDERRVLGENGRCAVMKNFTYEQLAKRFAQLFIKPKGEQI